MFNVKRNGASVEITDIPQSIPFSVFKDIADETGANECLVAYVKDKDSYEVVIRHDSVNMAGAAAWLALEASEPEAEDVDISAIGKRIGAMRVKQHMNTQELEEAIGASEGSVFRWETGKAIPSNKYINCLAAVLECDPQWLLNGNSNYKNKLPSDCESRNMEESVMIATREVSRSMEKHKINSLFKPYYILVI
ncbi:helix-turn-helix domain-containing protein [Salmonella enterica subsp. diarizonae]|uniref:Helix-turn-helix domain-containing protein n=1 Tax=Salmonella diarizonae TaxID=59204 RepID=A0A6C8XVQ5_SALDZ|nr:helix-turn-helix domain-containing protein [Salmonella enterica subsp. enterica serovar Albert]MIE68783.1 helix-turn-helix domain-containing protein [Salmonella enterica subsp. diarizonae]